MIHMAVILEGDNALKGIDPETIVANHVTKAIYLTQGTVEGKPSVSLVSELPDGTTVVSETTLALFLAAARAFEGRQYYEDKMKEFQS